MSTSMERGVRGLIAWSNWRSYRPRPQIATTHLPGPGQLGQRRLRRWGTTEVAQVAPFGSEFGPDRFPASPELQ